MSIDAENYAIDLLTAHRMNWIHTLRSAEFSQVRGSLFKMEVETSSDGYLIPYLDRSGEKDYGFCCLGVARCKVPLDGDNFLQEMIRWEEGDEAKAESDEERDYKVVLNFYGIDEKLRHYLMAMNDGEAMCAVLFDGEISYIQGSGVNYTVQRRIRRFAPSRSFKFIARFLEIVWKLS